MVKEVFSDDKLDKAAMMLKAIAHPVRISILCLLKNGEKLNVTEIFTKLNMGQSKVSHHLGILKTHNVLCASREGKNTFYWMKHESVGKIIDCLRECACNN